MQPTEARVFEARFGSHQNAFAPDVLSPFRRTPNPRRTIDMLKILGRRTSANVMKPLWVADEVGLDCEQVDIGGAFGGNQEPDYLAINPTGLIPTLVEDDFTLWESNAITRYLCQKFAAGSLWPDDPQVRASADMWMDWQQTQCAPMMRPIFWGLVRTPPERRDKQGIEQAIKEGHRIWGMLDRQLERYPFVAGETLTMGDIPIGPQIHRWLCLVKESERPAMPALEAWYRRLCDRPAFKKNVLIPIE